MIRIDLGKGRGSVRGGRPRPRVGPPGALGALIGFAMMAVLALVTLGLAAWVMRRRKPAMPPGASARVGREEAPPVGAGCPAPPVAGERREKSFAEVVEAWPIAVG